MCTGFICLRIGAGGGCGEHGNVPLGYVKGREFELLNKC
jgi:hypothetical protein